MSENKSLNPYLDLEEVTNAILKHASDEDCKYGRESIQHILKRMQKASTCEIREVPAADGFQQRCREMRCRSGHVSSDNKIVAFLYHLLRDHLPASKVEMIVDNLEGMDEGAHATFTNGYLGHYAIDMAERLV